MFALRPAQIAAPAPAIGVVAVRLGYDATPAISEARIRRMLDDEAVAWLSTVRPDGRPALVPTWFWWDGETMTVFSKPEAAKVANLQANPRLMVALGDPDEDFAVGMFEAEAVVSRDPVEVPAAFFAKYRGRLAEGRLDEATFRATYTQAIRIVPARYLAWHGRGSRHEGPASSGAVVRVRRWLAAVRDRVAGRPGPTYPRRVVSGGTSMPASPASVTPAHGAPRLPAWA